MSLYINMVIDTSDHLCHLSPMNKKPTANSLPQDRRKAALNAAQEDDPRGWALRKKWGSALDAGFFAVPDALIYAQHRLALSSTELCVLMHILVHWWAADELPHPRPSVIARRMGVTPRSVERTVDLLEAKGLLTRRPREMTDQGVKVRKFDLSGLTNKLSSLVEAGLIPTSPGSGKKSPEAAGRPSEVLQGGEGD